jgi:hypothetical protein
VKDTALEHDRRETLHPLGEEIVGYLRDVRLPRNEDVIRISHDQETPIITGAINAKAKAIVTAPTDISMYRIRLLATVSGSSAITIAPNVS